MHASVVRHYFDGEAPIGVRLKLLKLLIRSVSGGTILTNAAVVFSIAGEKLSEFP
jgi:hypothetical protein